MFGKRKNRDVADTVSAPVEPVSASLEPEVREDDPALIAVIAAAVAAYLGTSQNGIVIRSLRRSTSSTPKWGREGRAEQLCQQF